MTYATPTAVVTGAAGGIGAALARALVARGHEVVLADVDAAAVATLADELGGRAVPTDVADPDAVERLAAAAGPVELVCLNAGVLSTHPGPVWEAPAEEWDRVLGVNLGGVVNGLRAFVPRLLEDGRPAHVLVTASLAGMLTWPGGGPYAASKHAVVAVAEQAALGLSDTPVGVTVLCPALVRTGMSTEGADPVDVAGRALDAVDEGRFAVIDPEWHAALAARAADLAAGRQPSFPAPT
jgi:NADP-dependent 3-hydroxy acid dehydrogenase YdfG